MKHGDCESELLDECIERRYEIREREGGENWILSNYIYIYIWNRGREERREEG